MTYDKYIEKVDKMCVWRHDTGYFYLDPSYRYLIQKNKLDIKSVMASQDPIQDFDEVTDDIVSEQLKLQVQWLNDSVNNERNVTNELMAFFNYGKKMVDSEDVQSNIRLMMERLAQ